MCGIAGIVRLTGPELAATQRETLARMSAVLAPRGPDGEGSWHAPDGRASLAHRRLAVIDLSPGGAQPMSYPPGEASPRYHLTYNGEIYNYRELRRDLEAGGTRFRTASDSEVILALYARHGTGMLPRLRGMYALGLWDDEQKCLLLARDPYGIKPLYYAPAGDTLRFASQVRALEGSKGNGDASRNGIDLTLDPAGLAGFLLWGSVPEPWTIRRGIRALPAGTYLKVQSARDRAGDRGVIGEPVRHAPPPAVADSAEALRQERQAAQAGQAVTEALEESVRAHLVADVPVALFLSAGLDSTLLAALACRELRAAGAEPPRTFTLRFAPFAGTARDEGPLAARVAAALGTRHTERWVEADELRDTFPLALRAMDQPSIDGFNTFLVSRLAREAGLKVVLSGLGGDEIFGSYPSFRDVPRWAAWARRLRALPGIRSRWPGLIRRLAPRLARQRPKLAGLAAHGASLAGAYFLRRGLFLPEELPALLGADLAAEGLLAYSPIRDAATRLPRTGPARIPKAGSLAAFTAVHHLESGMYMRNQLLRDADWASMAHGLELRVPLVDPRLTATLAARGFQPARGEGKAAVVRRAAPELPEEVFRRPKSGFGIPLMEMLTSTDPGSPDPHGPEPRSEGLSSRRLALLVLREAGLL